MPNPKPRTTTMVSVVVKRADFWGFEILRLVMAQNGYMGSVLLAVKLKVISGQVKQLHQTLLKWFL